MDSYYFTFGTDKGFPFQGGWVEIEAESMKQAQDIFRAYFPDRVPGCLNCSDYYTRARMQESGMLATGNCGAYCHFFIPHGFAPLSKGQSPLPPAGNGGDSVPRGDDPGGVI